MNYNGELSSRETLRKRLRVLIRLKGEAEATDKTREINLRL